MSYWQSMITHHALIQSGGGGAVGGGGGPSNNHKNIGFVSSIGLDPLKIHKATKPAFNIGLF